MPSLVRTLIVYNVIVEPPLYGAVQETTTLLPLTVVVGEAGAEGIEAAIIVRVDDATL